MNAIDIDALLAPVPGEAGPLGPDVEEDAHEEFSNLELEVSKARAADAASDSKRNVGANWTDVRDAAVKLLGKSKQLRTAVYLTGALTRIEGYQGFAQGLSLIARLLSLEPDGCHPLNDSHWRAMMLTALNDRDDILGALRMAPLTDSRAHGRFNFRDYELAVGILKPVGETEQELVSEAQFNAALQDTETNLREQRRNAILLALEAVKTIEELPSFSGNGPQLNDLKKQLASCKEMHVEEQSESFAETVQEDGQPSSEAVAAVAASRQQKTDMSVNSVADCKRVLAMVEEYLNRTQPAHPAPMFISRAKRMLDMSFMEIIQELTPDSASEIRRLGGIPEQY